MIVVSGMAVDLLMDELTVIMPDVGTNIGVDVLVDVNTNVFAGIIISFGFAKPGPLGKFRC